MAKGWTPERRARQAELIRSWRPWEQSTGPRCAAHLRHSVTNSQTRAPRNVAVREMVAVMHPPDLANHLHGDHLQTLLKFAAGQLSTLVSFESALLALHGQFSVGVNP